MKTPRKDAELSKHETTANKIPREKKVWNYLICYEGEIQRPAND